MWRVRCGVAKAAYFLVVGIFAQPAFPAGAQSEFPFGNELRLDVAPMKGSKRVPILDVADNGAAVIDLWCNSVQGQVVVVADTITIMTGSRTERACPPEQVRGDDDMVEALQQVTNWRRQGDSLLLIGPHTLRFRLPTN
jgi:heat shock protein HslJ